MVGWGCAEGGDVVWCGVGVGVENGRDGGVVRNGVGVGVVGMRVGNDGYEVGVECGGHPFVPWFMDC